ALPVPATVVMIPLTSTLRIRWLSESAIQMLPAPSTLAPRSKLSSAFVAGPPSPEKPAFPVPATVEMMPSGEMRRTRFTGGSVKMIEPSGASASVRGSVSLARTAGPPSPLSPVTPDPADPVVAGVGDDQVPVAVEDDALRLVEQRLAGRAAVTPVAAVAALAGQRRDDVGGVVDPADDVVGGVGDEQVAVGRHRRRMGAAERGLRGRDTLAAEVRLALGVVPGDVAGAVAGDRRD